MKIERILCPTDFSEASAHAIDQAVAIAGWYKARITALHVVLPSVPPLPHRPASNDITARAEGDLEQLRKETAARFAAAARAGIGLDVVIKVGWPARCILERAADLQADLIVIGTHGTSGFEHLVLGSVAEKVLRKAKCPVVTVPPRAQAISRLPFNRLLCAVDFSDSSLTALRSALSLAKESGAALTVLHVLEWPWDEPPPPRLEELPAEQGLALAEYRRYCEKRAMARLESLVPDSGGHFAPAGFAAEEWKPYVQILDVAAEEKSDLIVLGVRGRQPLDTTLFGSTANQVVRHAKCPVLTLRQ